MSKDCPLKGKTTTKRSVPFKRKAHATQTINELSEEEEETDVANMEDVRSIASGSTKVSKQVTSKARSAQLSSVTLKSMINHLSTEEKQEMFEGFLEEGF